MKRIVVLGNPETKRTGYLRQAAVQAGLPVFSDKKMAGSESGLLFTDWKEWRDALTEGEIFLKIEPPLWKSSSLKTLNELTGEYERTLAELSRMGKGRKIAFFNHPDVIARLLDKRFCKKKLAEAGLPVTEQLQTETELSAEKIYLQTDELLKAETGISQRNKMRQKRRETELSSDRLLEMMKTKEIYQIFIKPVKGSGAAGVSAFRYQPSTGRMALYTCAALCPGGGLVNTKRLRHFSKPEDIFPLLDGILELDCILERWYAKAEYQGFSYDLRAVMQEGKMDFLLARLSKGPITNLHLNNRPLQIEDLRLPESVVCNMISVCQEAMACFEGVRCAGIDILLEKGSLNPRIIEMNGQGDLIYQDIYHENVIYRHQAEIMANWLYG